MFHDPPWKPWGIRHDRLAGCVKELWECIVESLIEEIKAEGGLQSSYLDEKLREAIKEYKSASNKIKSHTLQGALIARSLTLYLNHKGLSDLAELAENAERLILGDNPKLKSADIWASSIDRLLIHEVIKKLGKEHVWERKLLFINPFNPYLKQDLAPQIDVRIVARFIKNYSGYIAKILKNSQNREPIVLLHLAYSLIEPIWYQTVAQTGAKDPIKFMPPADTRIPIHTVFDHINAALASMLWLLKETEPSGCVVVFDLGSVQSWISESKALRDLWASSWLAAYLAWAAIKELVWRYGPGVMIQPPARLNAFYASELVGNWLNIGENNLRNELMKLLGLSLGWPLDPSMPSRVLITLPEEACNNIEEKLIKDYEGLWNKIMDNVAQEIRDLSSTVNKILELARSLIKETQSDQDNIREAIKKLERSVIPEKLVDKLKEIGPPLPVKMIKVMHSEALQEAKKIAKDLEGKTAISQEELKRVLVYPLITLKLVGEREGALSLRASGRRSNKNYGEFFRELYREWKGNVSFCTVCGQGIAVVDGKKISESLGILRTALKESNGQQLLRILNNMIAEIREDRLCPYCLVKRLLRRILESDSDGKIVGITMPDEVKKRIGRISVDFYTSRASLGYDDMKKSLEELLDKSISNKDLLESIKRDIIESLSPEVSAPLLIRNRWLRENDREQICNTYGKHGISCDMVEKLEGMILEIVHSRSYAEMLINYLEKMNSPILDIIKDWIVSLQRKLSRYRRRIAILKLDGDMMGKGVLRASLPYSKEEYAQEVFNVDDDKVFKKLLEIHGLIIESLEEDACLVDQHLSTIPTLSYHFTVSRALAAQSMLDRSIVERYEGMVIYSGGDDLLAIMRPVRWCEFSGHRIPCPISLEGSMILRRSYWGADSGGYNLVKLGDSVSIPVPALVAYGRSGSLFYVDSTHPLWASYRLSTLLEEAKDSIVTTDISLLTVGKGLAKDVLVVAGESGGISLLPLSPLPGLEKIKDTGQVDKTARLLKAAISLSALIARPQAGAPEPPISSNIVRDALDYVEPMYKALTMRSSGGLGGEEVAYALLRKLIARNIDLSGLRNVGLVMGFVSRDDAAEKILEYLAKEAGFQDWSRFFNVATITCDKHVVELIRASGMGHRFVYGSNDGSRHCFGQIPVISLISYLKVFREAV